MCPPELTALAIYGLAATRLAERVEARIRAHLATASTSAPASIGLARCSWKPARIARAASSDPA